MLLVVAVVSALDLVSALTRIGERPVSAVVSLLFSVIGLGSALWIYRWLRNGADAD
jgi:hypothetical protein